MTAPGLRKLRDVAVQLGPLPALVLVTLLFGWADAYKHGDRAVFLSIDNARTIAVQAVVVGTAALGMLLIIISGGIDLSAGTAPAFSATTLAWALDAGYGPAFAVGAAGMLQFARLKIGNPTTGRGLELGIIAAVVVGGAGLNGGRGTVLGTIAAAAAFDQFRQRRLAE